MNNADVLVHIHADLSAEERERLEKDLQNCDGVTKTHFETERPHLMLVYYDPATINSGRILKYVDDHGIEATLAGL